MIGDSTGIATPEHPAMDKEKLINCVFVREAIWNRRSKSHHNSLILTKLWKEVADECGTTVSLAKSKWKRLRETFMRKLAEIPVKRSGDGADEDDAGKPNWMYFNVLLFLKDQSEPRIASGNFPRDEDKSESIEEQDVDTERSTETDDESQSTNSRTFSPSLHGTPVPSSSATVSKEVSRKRQRVDSVGEGILRAELETIAHLKRKEESRQARESKELDEDEAFFKSILPHVRSLSAKQKMTFRIKVLQLLNDEIPSTSTST